MHSRRPFLIVTLLLAVAIAGFVIVSPERPAPRRRLPTPTTVTSAATRPVPPRTDPYANLRASLTDYCQSTGKGRAIILIRNGAPVGTCEH